MQLNKELIKRLANGDIQLQHTGTVEELNEILKAAFPNDTYEPNGTYTFYERWLPTLPPSEYHYRCMFSASPKPIYTTEQFFEVGPDHFVDVTKKMDSETRELAKHLYVHTGAGAEQCIEQAKQFIKLLNEQS